MADLKKRIIVTSNPQADAMEVDVAVDTKQLAQLFASIQAISENDLVSRAGPAGAFMFEPTPGVFQYLANFVRRDRGVIALAAAMAQDDTHQTLFIDTFQFQQGLAEYEALVTNERDQLKAAIDALNGEAAYTAKLQTALAD